MCDDRWQDARYWGEKSDYSWDTDDMLLGALSFALWGIRHRRGPYSMPDIIRSEEFRWNSMTMPRG